MSPKFSRFQLRNDIAILALPRYDSIRGERDIQAFGAAQHHLDQAATG